LIQSILNTRLQQHNAVFVTVLSNAMVADVAYMSTM